MIFDRLANGIQKHAKAIIVIWVVILCIGGFFAVKSGEVMSYDVTSMAPEDSESIIGFAVLQEHFPIAEVDVTSAPIIVIYYGDQLALQEANDLVVAINQAAKTFEPVVSLTALDPTSPTGPGIIMGMFSLSDSVESPTAFTPQLREFIDGVKESIGFKGSEYLTGMTAISYDMEHDALEDVSKIDIFTVLMILILIGLFFRAIVTPMAPPLTIGVAVVITLGLIYGLGQIMNIFFITNMLIVVSMMGAGCDYCIFIIARYREELRKGHTHDEAVHQAVTWAGESIAISGASVIIGFGAISVCDYSLISTMGICLALGVLVALIAALTLIPSILQLVGDKIFWPTSLASFQEGGKATRGWYAWCAKVGDSYFHKSARFSLKHAKAIAVCAILVSVPAVYVMQETEQSYDMITSMLGGESGEGMEYISEYADQGMIMPNYSIIEYKESLATVQPAETGLGTLYWTDYWKNTVSPTLDPLYDRILSDENIAYIEGPFIWDDMYAMIQEAGITDPDEQVQFIKDHISSTSALYLDGILQATSAMGLNTKYIINGLGLMIEDMVNIDFSWNAEVQTSINKGLTDSTAIVSDMEARFAEQHSGPMSGALKTIIDQFNAQGITNDMLVYGPGTIIDAQAAMAGLEFNWNQTVAQVKEMGITDPDTIVATIISMVPAEYQDAFNTMIQQLNAQGITNDMLVNGFGPIIDAQFAAMSFSWLDTVADIEAMGITDPDTIVTMATQIAQEESPTAAQIINGVLNMMHMLGFSNEIIINGFGPMIDYAMNIMPTVVGGSFVVNDAQGSHLQPGDVTYIKISSAAVQAAMSPRSMESIKLIDDSVSAYMADNKSIVVEKWDTGTAVVMFEVSEKVKQQFTMIEVLVVVLILILLLVVMRSYLIPLRSVLTILMSISWTLAMTNLVFVHLLGIDVLWMIPIILLVICLGLGMDYDILLTTRIKENVMARGMSNDDAIFHAVTHTGSVITICGLIMGGAFGTLMISGMPMLQEFGFALCFAILVDALIVRTYIVPAIMHLLGDWNWKGPGAKMPERDKEEE